jgi:hypothetical protein
MQPGKQADKDEKVLDPESFSRVITHPQGVWIAPDTALCYNQSY